MLRKAVPVLLLLLLLPACGTLPPLFPPTPPAPAARQTEEDLYQKAEINYRQQKYPQARLGYLTYLERYPQGKYAPWARLREAELLGLIGDWPGALRRYQALVEGLPEKEIALKARYGMGQAYFKLGQLQMATQVLDNLTAADLPRSLWFSTQALLAEIALKQGQVTPAFTRLRLAAQDLPSGDQEWFDDLKSRLVEQATPGELEHLATLYRDTPLSAALLLRLARLAQEAGRTSEAQSWVNTLKERFPQSSEAAAAERLLVAARARALGVLLPLRGDLGKVGLKVKQGMELAAKGAPLDLLFRDTHNDPGATSQLVRDLAQEPNLVAILGPLTSGVAQSAAQAAQAAGVPLIALSQKADITQTGELIFQDFLTARQQVRALVQRTLGQQGLKRYAILYPDSSYGRTFLENLQAELAAQGGELAEQEAYVPGTRDFAGALASLKTAARPDPAGPLAFAALFIPDDAATVAAIVSQMADTPLKGVQVLGTNLLQAPDVPAAQLKALEGVLFPDAFFAGDPQTAVQNFIAAYQQQYGEEPDYLATQGYAVVKVMAQLLETDKSLTRAELPKRLLVLKEFPHLPWFKGFNDRREAEPALYLLNIKDGRVQLAL